MKYTSEKFLEICKVGGNLGITLKLVFVENLCALKTCTVKKNDKIQRGFYIDKSYNRFIEFF